MLIQRSKERKAYIFCFIIFSILLGSLTGVLINDQRKEACLLHSNFENTKNCIYEIEGEVFPYVFQGAIMALVFSLIVLGIFWILKGEEKKG
jgi:hypothetical protein